MGLNAGIETLGSQAAGVDNYELGGVYCNRGRLAVTLAVAF